MSGGIFLIQNDGELVEMKPEPYDTEAVLQELLAKYPNLLAGDQIDGASPRQWLLISRELGVPGEEDGGDRWSVDHLFLDQDAIPTFVEVKRSSDTRIRREVLGQILEYAANAMEYCPVDTIRTRFEDRCRQDGLEPAKELETLLGPDGNIEGYWQRMKTNLHADKIRMVIVADEIPAELRVIVEFLNRQMETAEIVAIEIRQFVGKGLKTLVPRVYGQTAEVERKKMGMRPQEKQWDEAMFFADLRRRCGDADAENARRIYDWAIANVGRIDWGKGSKDGSLIVVLGPRGKGQVVVTLWSSGYIEIPFQHMSRRSPFDADLKRIELLGQFNQIPGVELPVDAIGRRPSIRMSVLTGDGALPKLLSVLDWYVGQIKSASVATTLT